MKLLRKIKQIAVVFYDAFVETRKLQAKNKFAQNGWY